jgi:hypothetical protein
MSTPPGDADINDTDRSLRDRLLHGFSDLSSYGIRAVPAAEGAVSEIHRRLYAEVVRDYPEGLRSYAFWTMEDDQLFDDRGHLPASVPLPIHVGYPRDIASTVAILSRVGVHAVYVDELRLHVLP